VQHLAANVEILIDQDDRRSQVARANGGGQPDATRTDDDDIGLVIPVNGVRRGLRRQRVPRHRQNGGADAGGRAFGDEIAPADRLLALNL
jgi:hypothetical protein